MFYGLCWTGGRGPALDETDEDALAERHARLALGHEPPPPRRYGDGTLVSEVTNAIDRQVKERRFGFAPDHAAWVARATAAYQALGVTLEAHGDRLSVFVTASQRLAGESDGVRLELGDGWPGGEALLRRYCEALRLDFDASKLGWWLTVGRS